MGCHLCRPSRRRKQRMSDCDEDDSSYGGSHAWQGSLMELGEQIAAVSGVSPSPFAATRQKKSYQSSELSSLILNHSFPKILRYTCNLRLRLKQHDIVVKTWKEMSLDQSRFGETVLRLVLDRDQTVLDFFRTHRTRNDARFVANHGNYLDGVLTYCVENLMFLEARVYNVFTLIGRQHAALCTGSKSKLPNSKLPDYWMLLQRAAMDVVSTHYCFSKDRDAILMIWLNLFTWIVNSLQDGYSSSKKRLNIVAHLEKKNRRREHNWRHSSAGSNRRHMWPLGGGHTPRDRHTDGSLRITPRSSKDLMHN